MKLTKQNIKGIKKWLGKNKEERHSYCPFMKNKKIKDRIELKFLCNICIELFPELMEYNKYQKKVIRKGCPCRVVGAVVVEKTFKELIAKNGLI